MYISSMMFVGIRVLEASEQMRMVLKVRNEILVRGKDPADTLQVVTKVYCEVSNYITGCTEQQ